MNFVVTYREKDGSRSKIAIEAVDRAGVFPILRERGISAIRVEEGKLPAKKGRSKWSLPNGLKLLLVGFALLSLVAVALTFVFNRPDGTKVSQTTTEEPELPPSIEKASSIDEKPRSGHKVADGSAVQSEKIKTNSKPVVTQAMQKRLPPSRAKKLTGPKSETVGGVTWFYETVSFEDQTCARIVPNNDRGKEEYVGALTIPSSLGGFPVICVGNDAFSGCRELTSVAIPEVMTDIGKGAFRGCTKLSSVTIPSSVTDVGWGAFFGCTGLTSVTIPAGVRSVDGSAFWGCSALKSILVDESNPFYVSKNGFLYSKDESTLVAVADGRIAAANGHVVIPSGVTTIGEYAFAGCSKLESVTIPSSVTSIGDAAFRDCRGLASVTIPSSVTSIGAKAFYDCSGLTSIAIHANVEDIGWWTFFGCAGLTSVKIPASVKYIGSMAFCGCTGLTSVTIPAGVRSIDGSAFGGCSALKSILVDESNPFYVSKNGFLYSKDESTLVAVADGGIAAANGRAVIPSSVTSIGKSAFNRCSALASVTIPPSVTNVGYGAFSGCSRLESVTVSMADKGDAARIKNLLLSGSASVDKLKFIEIPRDGQPPKVFTEVCIPSSNAVQSVKMTGTNQQGEESKTNSQTTETTNVVKWTYEIVNGVVVLGGGWGRTAVPKDTSGGLVIPEKIDGKPVCSIGKWAFEGCSRLESVTIPSSVTSIRNGAFKGCHRITSLAIPPCVKSIGYEAFRGCSGLKSLAIPSCVTNIGARAFGYCLGLVTVSIPPSVTNIGDEAFKGCRKIMSVSIPSSVTSIGDKAFKGCCKLADEDGFVIVRDVLYDFLGEGTSATIPSSVTKIGGSAFEGCGGLKSVTIPSSVTNIGGCAFEGCSGLTTVTIPSCVTNIGWGAFKRCGGLVSISIPSSVTSIGDKAFKGCCKLADEDGFVIVRDVLYDFFGKDTSVTIPSNVTSIGGGAFEGCRGLKSVTIPSSVTSIRNGAFYDCSGLTSLVIPPGVTSIGGNMLCGCSNLTSVTIPSSVTNIGAWAFYNCSGLASVTIPQSVTSIGEHAFAGCDGLTSVKIPEGVMLIDELAFEGCAHLASVAIPSSVTRIECGSAFWFCSRLHEFAVSPDNPNYSSVNGLLLSKQGDLLLQCVSGDVSIPSSVTNIDACAFMGCIDSVFKFSVSEANPKYSSVNGLLLSKKGDLLVQGINGDVTIPPCVTSIGEGAFCGCSGLKSVTIPSSVASIGKEAFKDCGGLETIYVDEGDENRVKSMILSSGASVDKLKFVKKDVVKSR